MACIKHNLAGGNGVNGFGVKAVIGVAYRRAWLISSAGVAAAWRQLYRNK